MPRVAANSLTCLLAIVFICAGLAHANTLQVAADAPLIAHLGAGALLYAHIGGGTMGLLSGTVAIASPKGGSIHRAAGKVFLVSMFVAYLIGAGVAPFLDEGQRPNFVAGVLALYLLITAWLTVRRGSSNRAGLANYIGAALALIITGLGIAFMIMGLNSPTGTIDGSPPQAFVIFMVAGSLAFLGEINMILRRALIGPARLARHLWRMCASMFFASASLFFGQPQVFSDAFNRSLLPAVLSFAPLIAMLIWIVLVRVRPARQRVRA